MLYNPPPGGAPPMAGATAAPTVGAAQAPAGVTDPSMMQPTIGAAQAPAGVTSPMPGLASPPPVDPTSTSFAPQNTQPQVPVMGGLGSMDPSAGMAPQMGGSDPMSASFSATPQNAMVNALNQTGAGTSQLNPNFNPAAFA